MIRKSDQYFKRTARIWARGHVFDEKTHEYVRREMWWLFFILPIYIRETIVDKPR